MPQKLSTADSALWADLVHALPGMVYRRLHDARHTLLRASDGCRALTGYDPIQLQDNQLISYGALIHPEDRPSVGRIVDEALQEREPYLCTYRLLAADGREKWVLDRGRAVFRSDGTVRFLEGVVIENTERVRAFQALQQDLTERSRKLASLYEIFSAAATSDDLSTALARVLRRALVAARGDVAFLHLLDAEGQTARLVAHEGLSPASVRELTEIDSQHPLIADSLAHGRFRLLFTGDHLPHDKLPCACCRDMDAYLGVPIQASGRLLGVLSLLSLDRRRLAAEEIELFVSVADQIGALVETERLRQQVAQLAVVEERHRLARELHDAVTQSLYSVVLFAEAGRRLAAEGDLAQAGVYFSDVTEIGQQALREMRLLLHRLRPAALHEAGLARALEQRLESVEGRLGIRRHLELEGPLPLSPSVEEALYHIAQEALNNALRHTRASEVSVRLQCGKDGLAQLRVTDDGQGFEVEEALAGAGLGLSTMRERARALGGTVSYCSVLGKGTTVHASIPAQARPQDNPQSPWLQSGESGRERAA